MPTTDGRATGEPRSTTTSARCTEPSHVGPRRPSSTSTRGFASATPSTTTRRSSRSTAGSPARLHLRHVLVGHRLRPGAQHQRADGHLGGEAGLGGDPAGASARRQRHATRARVHRGYRASATRPIPPPTAPRWTPPTPGPCATSPGSIPSDPDAQTLYAEALMDLSPWNYWTDRGRNRGRAPGSRQTLERTVKRTRITRAPATSISTSWKPRPSPAARSPVPTDWPS